jgi:hypothetical protein
MTIGFSYPFSYFYGYGKSFLLESVPAAYLRPENSVFTWLLSEKFAVCSNRHFTEYHYLVMYPIVARLYLRSIAAPSQ